MATIDSVASAIGTAISAANTNVANALTALTTQFMATRSGSLGFAAVPALNPLVRSTADAASFTAMEDILTNLRSDLNGITEDVAAITTIPTYGALETPIWSETYWTNLKTLLTNMIGTVTNASNVDTVLAQLTSATTRTQNAMFSKDRDFKLQTLNDLYAMADSKTGAKGFSKPNSMTTVLKLDAQQKYQFAQDQICRDIIKQIFDWADSSYKYALDKQISVHAADVEFNLQYRRMAEAVFAAEAQRVFTKYQREVEMKLLAVEKAIVAYRIAFEKIKSADELSMQEIVEQVRAYALNVQQSIAGNQVYMNTVSNGYTTSVTAAKDALVAAASVASSSTNSVIGVMNQAG